MEEKVLNEAVTPQAAVKPRKVSPVENNLRAQVSSLRNRVTLFAEVVADLKSEDDDDTSSNQEIVDLLLSAGLEPAVFQGESLDYLWNEVAELESSVLEVYSKEKAKAFLKDMPALLKAIAGITRGGLQPFRAFRHGRQQVLSAPEDAVEATPQAELEQH
jgi:hypothetical protein